MSLSRHKRVEKHMHVSTDIVGGYVPAVLRTTVDKNPVATIATKKLTDKNFSTIQEALDSL